MILNSKFKIFLWTTNVFKTATSTVELVFASTFTNWKGLGKLRMLSNDSFRVYNAETGQEKEGDCDFKCKVENLNDLKDTNRK